MNPGLIHLNCGSIGATPRVVIDAVSNYLREIEGNPLIKTFTWGGERMDEDALRQHLRRGRAHYGPPSVTYYNYNTNYHYHNHYHNHYYAPWLCRRGGCACWQNTGAVGLLRKARQQGTVLAFWTLRGRMRDSPDG